jgi:GNAT superfamily N-acetyltransferase/phosphoribosyl-ATP pyrophosphohydrolase
VNELLKLLDLEKDARSFGFDWPDQLRILAQIIDECQEIREDLALNANKEKIQEEIGDLLHAVISLCRFSGFNVEDTLRKVNVKFSRRMIILKGLVRKKGLKDLKGKSMEYMLTFWDEAKSLENAYITPAQNNSKVLLLTKENIPVIVSAFDSIGWDKPATLFEGYLKEAQNDERVIWLALVEGDFAGYITLKWQSLYASFKEKNIPEIMDLNVLPYFRNKGIGSDLLKIAEHEATKRSDTVGIGVGLYTGEDGGYGSAQRLYVKLGYIPDGKGVTYHYQPTTPGNDYQLNDDLVLWFTKSIVR